ncbi:queuosine salvage protein-like isoform X1 [Nylanderia fulva]|uniref:queuosine salvage protein-like isoform X1 n=1 Tax=Nylanderia fulva TaxID=613905 RepID=UPI0010FB6678|nr:queuosine salvage protein-like isoform X1 [Nylanderia fulva]
MAEDNSSAYDVKESLEAEIISSDYDVKESLEAAKFISEKAQDVHIDQEGIKKLTAHVITYLRENTDVYKLTNHCRRHATYPSENDSRAINWLFVLQTLNFALCNRKGRKQWAVDGAKGYIGLCIAIKRAIDEGKPIWDPNYYTKMTQSDLEYILRGDDDETSIPLIQERFTILRKVGEILLDKYDGTFVECVKAAEYDADKLLKLLFDEFESYRDEAEFEGLKVRLHSKAMSLIIDIWYYYKLHKFNNRFRLDTQKMMSTMFMDYRTPQVLLHFKVLRYSEMLVTRFENSDEPLQHGSREELEIRGCSLIAAQKLCEEVRRESKRYGKEIPLVKTRVFNVPILVDNYILGLTAYSHEELMKREPFHYVRSVYY